MFNGTGSSCNIPPGITYADTFNCSFGYYSQNLLTAVFDLQSTYDDNYTLYVTTDGKFFLLNKLLIAHPSIYIILIYKYNSKYRKNSLRNTFWTTFGFSEWFAWYRLFSDE